MIIGATSYYQALLEFSCFRLIAYLLNMFEPTIFIQHFIYLYKFLNKIDAYKYKFLETGTSDRTLLWVSDQLLGCSLYPRSFFLYSPFNGKNLIKNQENQSRESRKET